MFKFDMEFDMTLGFIHCEQGVRILATLHTMLLFLQIAKMGLYFKKKSLTDVCFFIFVVFWTIPRVLYFPLW